MLLVTCLKDAVSAEIPKEEAAGRPLRQNERHLYFTTKVVILFLPAAAGMERNVDVSLLRAEF